LSRRAILASDEKILENIFYYRYNEYLIIKKSEERK